MKTKAAEQAVHVVVNSLEAAYYLTAFEGFFLCSAAIGVKFCLLILSGLFKQVFIYIWYNFVKFCVWPVAGHVHGDGFAVDMTSDCKVHLILDTPPSF